MDTDVDNGVGFCWWHHVLIHDEKWQISGHPATTLTFTGPDGRTHTSDPKPLSQQAKQLWDDLRPRPAPPEPTTDVRPEPPRLNATDPDGPDDPDPGRTPPPEPGPPSTN